MANSTYSTLSFSSKGKSNNTTVHPRINASNDNNDTGNNRSYRPRGLWRYLQQLVRNQRSAKWEYSRSQYNLYSTHSRGTVSTRNCDQACRSSGTDRYKQNNYYKRYYYVLIALLSISSPVTAEVYNNAAPTSTATGNVTNQAVQFQNTGSPSRQNYGGGIACNGPTMTVTPFYMGNDSIPYDNESYVTSNNWGAQLNFMVPLDWGTINRCKAIAKRQEEKLRLDYELVRALKCAELQQKGFTFRPGSRVEHMCNDVVPISQLTKQTTE